MVNVKKVSLAIATALVTMGSLGSVTAEDFEQTSSVLKVHTGDTVRELIVEDDDVTVEDVLDNYGLKPVLYRASDGSAIDETLLSDTKEIFKRSVGTESFDVSIPHKTQVVKSDEIYEGETRVKQEGKDGTAKKTVVTSTDDSGVDLPVTVTESLSLVSKPIPEIIEEGTKKRPAPQSAPSGPTPVVKPGANEAVNIALQQIGKPYVWANTGPNSFDCSGLIYYIYNKHLGYNLPRTAAAQGRSGTPVAWSDIQPGDVIWNSGHIGIYVGEGMMVHAANPRKGVIMSPIKWFMSDYSVARF